MLLLEVEVALMGRVAAGRFWLVGREGRCRCLRVLLLLDFASYLAACGWRAGELVLQSASEVCWACDHSRVVLVGRRELLELVDLKMMQEAAEGLVRTRLVVVHSRAVAVAEEHDLRAATILVLPEVAGVPGYGQRSIGLIPGYGSVEAKSDPGFSCSAHSVTREVLLGPAECVGRKDRTRNELDAEIQVQQHRV